MTPYHMGIVWSIGSYQEGRFVFRHKTRYFLEQLRAYTKSQIYKQKSYTGDQYVLKSACIDFSEMKEYGWTERNAEQRNIPVLDDYRDFLRAYFEIHSTFSWQTSYTKSGKKYYRLRMRVFGNGIILRSISRILHEYICIPEKTLQSTGSEKSFYLQYTSLSDIEAIIKYIEGEPCFEAYWENTGNMLKNPRRYQEEV